MTFHGKPSEDDEPRQLRNFAYRLFDGGMEHGITAHEIYFYEAGRIGFWNYDGNGERVLVLATKAFQVRQVTAK
jgi:hypothetical protein